MMNTRWTYSFGHVYDRGSTYPTEPGTECTAAGVLLLTFNAVVAPGQRIVKSWAMCL